MSTAETSARRAAAVPTFAARGRPNVLPLVVAGIAVLLAALVLGVLFGTVALPLDQTVAIVARRVFGLPVAETWTPATETIVLQLRLPRVLLAMVTGAGLALAGATLQGLLRNPLADPYVLGTASGAALGAAIAVLLPVSGLVLGLGLLHLLAFVGALTAVAVVYRLSRVARLGSLAGLLLTGYAVGSLLSAGLAVAMYLSGAELPQIVFYLLGSFASAGWSQLIAALPLVVLGSVLILMRARLLDALLLGEEAATHLGIDVVSGRRVLLGAAALVTAAGVAVSGLIGFVGLVVPHVVRMLAGPSARTLLPLSMLGGAGFLALADLVARLPGELPVGVITALAGAPFFLSLLRSVRAGYEM